MVHQVILFIDGIHFGLAIQCKDGWYKYEYAASGGSGVSSSSSSTSGSSKTTNAVTIKRSAPTGEKIHIGDTNKSLDEINEFARKGS